MRTLPVSHSTVGINSNPIWMHIATLISYSASVGNVGLKPLTELILFRMSTSKDPSIFGLVFFALFPFLIVAEIKM